MVCLYVPQVHFQDSNDNNLLEVLLVQIQFEQQRVDRVFHFYHPEVTFISKAIELPTSVLRDASKPYTRCSNTDALCEVKEKASQS